MASVMDTEISQTRGPLMEKPNSPPPTFKQVRRKNSFIRRIDSSEECPSPHNSIHEAYFITASDESFDRIEASMPMVELHKTGIRTSNNENEREIKDVDFLYGRGTILRTIAEKYSNGTIRSLGCTRSTDGASNIPFLGHRDSFLVAKSPRRKQSFSLNDVHLINRSYHEVCHEIYASPKVPLRGPVERPGTPPGMPSWTAAQTSPGPPIPRTPYHIPGTPNRFQRFLGIEPSGVTFSSRIPHPEAARVVSAPITMGTNRQAPRFRPPRSAYGPISRHPFNSAPIAPVSYSGSPTKKVRFTPSATARDSAEISLRNAIESTSTLAVHPMAPIRSMIPIAQAGSANPKRRICLHRKKQDTPPATTLNAVNLETSVNIQTSHLNPTSSTASLMDGGRSPGLLREGSGSASYLVAGGLRDTSMTQNEGRNEDGKGTEGLMPCWKCFFEKCMERAGRLWDQTGSCLCFVCCGYECDDESTVYGSYPCANGSGYFDQCSENRRDILEQTPASMV